MPNMDTSGLATTTGMARILVVDDHPNTASMLARALGNFQRPVEVLTARSGHEALDIIGDGMVDVLITDFMMPGINGLELIEKLQNEREPAHIILITAYDSPGLAATAKRLKVNDYLVKPVQPEKIRGIVSHVLDGLHTSQPTTAEPEARAQFKILIADDRPDNLQLLATRLESEGYTFVPAGDGDETIQKIRDEMPDLVLLDVNMPRKDGFEVLKEVRADPQIAHTPIIILTAARIEPRDVRQGLSLGADDYITKPFDWRELAARIKSKLRVKQAEDALRRRNRELNLLPSIGQDLSARLDVEDLAAISLQRSVEALNAISGHLVIFQPDGSALHKFHGTRDFSPLNWEQVQEKFVNDGIVPHIIRSQEGIAIEDTSSDARWLKLPNDPTRSMVAVPLLSRRGAIGVLSLQHSQVSYFNSDHITLLQAIASQAAIAIENAQLYAIEHKRVSELVALNQLSRQISVLSRSADLFDMIPQLIREALGYPVLSLWLTEPDKGKLSLRSLADTLELPADTLAVAPQQVMNTGQPAHFSGKIEEAAVNGNRASGFTQSAMAVPLFWGAGASGVLAIHSNRPQAFQESDRVVLENLASQIAAALERIQLFESVEQEEKRLDAVLRAAADAILVIDPKNILRLLNPAARQLFTDVETKIGHPLPPNKGYDELMRLLENAGKSGAAERGEIVWPDKRVFAAVITPVEDGGQVAVLHDVTHFKDVERVKNEFIATASHDLKGPITAIVGYSQLLDKAGPLNPMQTDYVGRMQRATNQMLELVQSMLDLARIDMGAALNYEPISVRDLLASVVDEYHAQALTQAQTLILTPLEGYPQVKGDSLRLRQAVRNLVGNALKYSPKGGTITVSALMDANSVAFTVKDTGYGIPAADIPFIFDKFYRVHADSAPDVEGNGLGLAIVKAIVDQHGGKVEVESTPGTGSTFTISIPTRTLSN
jgi:signal transduction histidine kinase/DNA-binding response OmpR family regulator